MDAAGRKNIVLIARAGSSPHFTFSALAEIYAGAGHTTRVVESLADVYSADVIITHNINGLEDRALSGLIQNGSRVVSFIDTPYNKVGIIRNMPQGVIMVFTDAAYNPVAAEINGRRNVIVTHPLEISIQKPHPVKLLAERKFDVLFAGRLVEFDSLNDYSSAEKKLAGKIIAKAMHEECKPIHEIAREVFAGRKRFGLYRHSFTSEHFLNYCWKLSHTLRKERKLKVISELVKLNSGIKCCFISNNTDIIRGIMGEGHTYRDFMPWKDVVDLMHESKVVINTMPGHVDCLHEHMVEAMVSGAVCASDENRMTRTYLADGENFIGFNYADKPLAAKLEVSLKSLKKLQEVADAGRGKIAELVRPEQWLLLLDKIGAVANA